MKNFTHYVLFAFLILVFSAPSNAQVSTYTFASSSATFTSIVGGVGTNIIATTADDENFGTYNIGFTFEFNGNNYTTFGLNANGFISMGYVPVTTNNALSSGLNNNIISAFNTDLYGIAANAQISYQTSGSGTNHVLTVEWTNWGFFSSGTADLNFQIKLVEGTNKIQIVYGSCPGSTSKNVQVGLRGQTNADFNNRTTTSNWSLTTAGAVNNATCTYSSTVKPSSGLTFTWTPVASPKVIGVISSVQQTGTAAPATTANTILRVDVPITGTTGTLTLNSVSVVSKNTNDNDVSANGVKLYYGTSSGPTTQIGNGASFSSGTASFSLLNYTLLSGTNYLWVCYDIKVTATVNNVLDAKVNIGGMGISASGGAVNPGTQPTSALNPTGNKTVNYCTPVSAYGGCLGDQVSGFTFAAINYNSGGCLSSPGYLDVGTTGTTTQGQSPSFILTLGDVSDYASIWIDYNDNASFDDANELVYSGGPGTSLSGNISVPLNANVGTHRMRVRDNFDAAPPSSCGSISFGETKDFRITINQATNCTGTPASSSTLSTANPVCSGVNFTLSLTTLYVNLGITYQWQSSANGNTYSNIGGATSSAFTTSLAASTYYRCQITCTNSGQSVFSSALLVNLNPFTNCYCIPSGTDCNDDRITSVVFAGINNSTGCSANGYGDFSAQTGSAAQGSTPSISVGVSDGGTEYVSVWIDYNHNAVFESGERTFIGSGFSQTISSTISIPFTAQTGATHMRVRLEFAFEPTDPCEVYNYGETEDYSLNITACVPVTFYADADGDTYGNLNSTVQACSAPSGYVNNSTDCNDANAAVHPGAPEVCNNIDDNCNNQIDEGVKITFYADADNDTYGNLNSTTQACSAPSGYVSNSTDCNDANAAIHPGASDVCNGIDDNCNNQIDENAITATVTPSGTVTVCDGISQTFTANSGAGISYQWLKNGNNISGATLQTYSTKKAANYSVHETNNFNCSSTSSSTTFTVLTAPAATITPQGNLDICQTGSVVLQANSGAGYTYQWKKGANNIAGATGISYTATMKATYKVIVTASNGCSTTSKGTKVTKSCKEGAIDEEVIVSALEIYPNPSAGNFLLALHTNSSAPETADVIITNLLGQIIFEKEIVIINGELNEPVQLDAQPAGNYFVRVICSGKEFAAQLSVQ